MQRASILAASAIISALLCLFAYNHYLSHLACFNEQGRCFEAETGVVYLEQSGIVWLALAVVSVGATLYQVWRLVPR